ncbi:aminoglycoside phosphotransferase family protein [Nonomuraea sp. NPDC000554]|uniref:aminoglycoside phosphotransferase family protein n=1 Tax=Nonomuraea sp. NPDC000554 TaxID=3154259 RepID=UPI00331A5451
MGTGKMHEDEADIDESLVRRLLAAQFPQWADLPVEPVASSGADNAMYRLGDDMAVRLPRIEWAVRSVGREQEWLPRLAPLLPVAVPVLLGRGVPGEGHHWPWSVLRWLDGENPAVGQLADPELLAEDLAEFVLALRSIDPADGPPAGWGQHLATLDESARTAIGELDGLVDTGAVTAVWEESLRLPEWAGPAVWIHGDLSPGNVLLTQGRLSAVIDFGSVGVGDPTTDLIAAWNLLPPGARDVYRDALRVDEATWLRGRGWALVVALVQLSYYRATNPVRASGARQVIREVLADHQRSA